jgi:ankyrin repeat protein
MFRSASFHLRVLGWQVKLLIEHGADISGRYLGRQPIHRAATAGNAQLVELLIASGADPRAIDDQNKTALHVCRTAQVAEALIRHGADVNRLAGAPDPRPLGTCTR